MPRPGGSTNHVSRKRTRDAVATRAAQQLRQGPPAKFIPSSSLAKASSAANGVRSIDRTSRTEPNPEFVAIFAGAQRGMFRVHRKEIIHYSSHFRDAFLQQRSVEGETKIMILPDIDDKVFGLFNNWLYTQQIEHASSSSPSDNVEPAKTLELMEVAKLWTCARTWRVPELQNQAMNLLKILLHDGNQHSLAKDAVIWQFLKHAYVTKDDTPLKRLALHTVVKLAPGLIPLRDWLQEFPEGLLVDFTERLMTHIRGLPKEHQRPKGKMADLMVNEDLEA